MKKIIAFSCIVYSCVALGHSFGAHANLISFPVLSAGLSIGTVIGVVLGLWISSAIK